MKVTTLYKGPISDWKLYSPVARKLQQIETGTDSCVVGRRGFLARAGSGLIVLSASPTLLIPDVALAQKGLVRGTITALELLKAIIELLGTLPLSTTVANNAPDQKSGLLVCDYRAPNGKVTDQADQEVTLPPGYAQDISFEGNVGNEPGRGVATVTSGLNKKSAPYKIA